MLYILAIIVFVVLSSALVRGFILSQRIMDSLDKPKKKRIQNVTFTRLESIRQLTEEEDILLQPYLDNKDLITCPYQWESSLISSDVTTIKGYIKREHANNAKIKVIMITITRWGVYGYSFLTIWKVVLKGFRIFYVTMTLELRQTASILQKLF